MLGPYGRHAQPWSLQTSPRSYLPASTNPTNPAVVTGATRPSPLGATNAGLDRRSLMLPKRERATSESLVALWRRCIPGWRSRDLRVLREILAGGHSKIEESEARLCGGHSIQDDEPKYGLSVTGFVEKNRVVRNAGAKVGDVLVLTKPLGIGILTTALKRDLISENEI